MNKPLFDTSFALPSVNPEITPQRLCPGNVPLVLLPVRLETRFFELPDGSATLRVRVYPDKIHIDTHQPDLTAEEQALGMQYWQQDWAAGDETARADAWHTLASRVDAERAAWIARVLQPTNLAQRPKEPPVFPPLPPVRGEHAPVARLLPDRWTAVLHSGGTVALTATGNDIQRELAVGLNPNVSDDKTDMSAGAGDTLALDEDMMWLVDFDKAQSAGMALTMTVPAAVLETGVDSLMVFGVADSPDTADTANRLADLLDAHHYTDGLEFLRFGTPTNNTDDRRAGYSTDDPGHRRSFANEVVANPENTPNARLVGTVLGLPSERIATTLGRVGQAGQDHERDLRSMNAALWQVGWGYFLSNMMSAETGFTAEALDWARNHFLNYVRSGGPFPSLRCGTQPYGILPVTSLDLWTPEAGEASTARESRLKELLLAMRNEVWRPVVHLVARIGLRQETPGKADPDSDLADVMRTDGVSHGHLTRRVLGRHYLEHLYALAGRDFSPLAVAQGEISAKLIDRLKLTVQKLPRLARCFLDTAPVPVTAPLVHAGEISPWQRLESNYISALLETTSIEALITLDPPPSPSLLYALLRHALLREIAEAAARMAATVPDKQYATLDLLRDSELVDLVDGSIIGYTVQKPADTLHWKRQLEIHGVPGLPADQTIGRYLEDWLQARAGGNHPAVAALGEFRAGLAHLQMLDTESLHYLMQSTLDLSSHRLDAWITSFATKRLKAMTPGGSPGVYVGAYGWVENLRPAHRAEPIPAELLPPGEQAPEEQAPLYPLANDSGFIHAPSLTHASAAALLRNAHLGPDGVPQPDGSFAIDLSSRRVRDASRLLEGVRQGQPLGALLGYRLERRLHEAGLDHFIAPLRKISPLAVRKRETDAWPNEIFKANAANNVVDGLELFRAWKAYRNSIAFEIRNVGSDDERFRVEREIEALGDAIDGLGDALVAEAAYQIARGNTPRLASTLSAIALGDAPVPELEVARIPRTGTSLTHRVLVLFSGVSNAGGGWTNSTTRTVNERWLNAWIRLLLGDARKVRCTVERLDDTTGAVTETAVFPLSDVPMSTLDFVYSVQPGGQSATADASPCLAEQRVLYHARRLANGFGNDAGVRLQHERPADLAAGETTLFDVLEQARAIRRLLQGARGLRPEDLSPPDRPHQSTLDLADLEARVVRYENGLNAAHKTLASLVSKAADTLAEDFRTAILNLGHFSVEPAVPGVAVGDTPEIRSALARQAAAMLKVSGPRLEQGAALRTRVAATAPRARCDQLLERGRAVYGAEFVSLPSFTCDAAGAAELNAALAAGTRQQGGDPLAVHGWFMRASRVRDALAPLGLCLQTAEVFATGARLNLNVAQLPFNAEERWVGLPGAGKELPPSKLSLVVQPMTAIDAALPLSGLFIDEWVEVVPNKEETTALTFQFDPPNAFPPQNVLIAVPPVPGQDWTTETLRCVLAETLDLAKLRAVDTRLLGAAAQYLPGIYVPFNVADDAVSTDFAPLTA